ncbi:MULTISPECIES: NUDIX hydrolase [Agrobacterium]|uniref:NUDIX hydrolase n=1 Tax=Agrobacterium TaxID=357 RepID=UPI003B9E15D5
MARGATRSGRSSGGAKAEQYAALCVRSAELADGNFEVLLITSRETGRWVILKGWSMQKKKPYQVAKLEAWEEAVVRGRVSKEPFGHYTYDKKMSRDERLSCLVQVHLLTVWKWCSPADAALAVNEPGLQQLIFNLQSYEADK